MCGRYSLTILDFERFGLGQLEIEFGPRFNIAPTQQVLAVIQQNRSNCLQMYRWGLIPYWAKDTKIGNNLINARQETLEEKPSFRNLLASKRCLILADGYYEWKREGRVKKPYRITLQDRKVFAFAGLWDSWVSHAGQRIDSCTIITTTSNKLVASIHNRMPVILPINQESVWLDQTIKWNSELKSLLKPFPEEQLDVYEVSQLVNSPRNDQPECLNRQTFI